MYTALPPWYNQPPPWYSQPPRYPYPPPYGYNNMDPYYLQQGQDMNESDDNERTASPPWYSQPPPWYSQPPHYPYPPPYGPPRPQQAPPHTQRREENNTTRGQPQVEVNENNGGTQQHSSAPLPQQVRQENNNESNHHSSPSLTEEITEVRGQPTPPASNIPEEDSDHRRNSPLQEENQLRHDGRFRRNMSTLHQLHLQGQDPINVEYRQHGQPVHYDADPASRNSTHPSEDEQTNISNPSLGTQEVNRSQLSSREARTSTPNRQERNAERNSRWQDELTFKFGEEEDGEKNKIQRAELVTQLEKLFYDKHKALDYHDRQRIPKVQENLKKVQASQVAQWEKMKQSRTTIKILIEEFIQMFPNKIPPVDKLFNEINLGKYIQQRIQQTPKINIGNYTQHTEIVKNKAPYLRPQVFDNVWYTDEAGITQHYRVTELNKSTKRATLRYHMDSTFTVDVKDIRVVDEDEAYKGFYGAGADVCRETAESMRTKLLAANKTAQSLTPSSHSSNSHPSRAHALNAVAARPLNSRLHCVTLSIELAYSFKRYVDKCPLQDLESRDSHFINAMCAKWRSFTEQHKTGNYGLFFQFVGIIINTAQLTEATVVDTLRELEGMIDGHVDHEELRHRIVGDIQTRGEPIKSYVSRKCVNKSLLGKLYTSKKAMFLGIAKGIESQAVKTKVLEWLALEEESNLTEGYVTQGFAKIHKQYHMFQSSNSLIESEWKPKTGVRAVTAATNNSTKKCSTTVSL